jgi:hypothetical protein
MMYFVSFIPNQVIPNQVIPISRNKGTLYLESSTGRGIYRNYDISSHVYDAVKSLNIVYFGDVDFKELTDVMTRHIEGGDYYELIRLDKIETY